MCNYYPHPKDREVIFSVCLPLEGYPQSKVLSHVTGPGPFRGVPRSQVLSKVTGTRSFLGVCQSWRGGTQVWPWGTPVMVWEYPSIITPWVGLDGVPLARTGLGTPWRGPDWVYP